MKNIISLSGGKDSTAMLLECLRRGVKIDRCVFFDTGWEFPGMVEHVKLLEKNTGVPVVFLEPDKKFEYLMFEHPIKVSKQAVKGKKIHYLKDVFLAVKKYNPGIGKCPRLKDDIVKMMLGKIYRYGYGWPAPCRRWCTARKVAKIEKYFKSLNFEFTRMIGYAFEEQHRRDAPGQMKLQSRYNVRYPLIDWKIDEKQALKICYNAGYEWGGLYEYFSRVSCFCCPLQPINELRKLRKHFPNLWAKMLEWERKSPEHNRGFKDYTTVHDLERRFAYEDLQQTFNFES